MRAVRRVVARRDARRDAYGGTALWWAELRGTGDRAVHHAMHHAMLHVVHDAMSRPHTPSPPVATPQVKNVLALDYCLADELSVPVRQLVDGMLQINPDDRTAACSLTKCALPGAGTLALAHGNPLGSQQGLGCLGPAVQPRSLSEAPPKTPMSRPLPSQAPARLT